MITSSKMTKNKAQVDYCLVCVCVCCCRWDVVCVWVNASGLHLSDLYKWRRVQLNADMVLLRLKFRFYNNDCVIRAMPYAVIYHELNWWYLSVFVSVKCSSEWWTSALFIVVFSQVQPGSVFLCSKSVINLYWLIKNIP